jgi:type I restriction enzyme S subunit
MFIPDSDAAIKVYEQKNAIEKDELLGAYFISPQKFEELKAFEVYPDDIIVSCAGTIGETFIMPTTIRRGIINQALMRIMLYDKSMMDFYLLYFDFVLKADAQKHAKGTAIKNIPPFDVLKQFLMPIPPLAEQKRIVIAIEAAFEQLDSIVATLA